MVIVLNDYLVHSCYEIHLGSRFLQIRLLDGSWAPLRFLSLWIMAKILCLSLCSFEAIVELHPKDQFDFNDFLKGK